jgi:uncharacterized protein
MKGQASDPALSPLDGFRFVQLVAVPSRPENKSGGPDNAPAWELGSARLFAALTAANAALSVETGVAEGAFMMAWVREPGAKGFRLILGGRPQLPWTSAPLASHAELLRLPYPPGALVRDLPNAQVTRLLETFPCWAACAAQPDALWPGPGRAAGQESGRGSFDDHAAHMPQPFTWLVTAQPQPRKSLDDELADLETHIPGMRQRQNSETDRVRLERAEARYRELTRSRPYGTWTVRVLAGSTDAAHARSTAALLCGASELGGLAYALAPTPTTGILSAVLAVNERTAGAGQTPFTASTEMLAALARPPARELPGIRLAAPPPFDITPETANEPGVDLGTVLDETLAPASEFRLPYATLNRHAFVCGATGAGKSQTVRSLLEALANGPRPVPWLVIEPAKAEYARMAGRLAGRGAVTVIRPGDPNAIPGCLNPLEPEPGFPLQTHIDLVRALFLAAFDAYEPFPQVLSHALARCYQSLGWDLALSEPCRPGVTPAWPTLADLRRDALAVVDDIGYGREVTADVRGFIDVRISSLRLGTPGRFFEGGHPLDIADLMRRNVVLELEDVGNDQDKAFLIGAVLIRVAEHLRQQWGKYEGKLDLQHVTVVEEAHRLLKIAEHGSPAAHAVELFAGLLAEIRAYGEGIVVAEQIPSKVVADVIKNSALKIVHRLPAHDDRFAVGATMNLDGPQSQYVVTLPPGQAAVFADGMDHPILVAMPYGESRESAKGVSRVMTIIGRRSIACGAECQARACTLREMTYGQRLADDPRFTLWIELLTVAHLVGEAEPRPAEPWLAELRKIADRRTLECAIGHRVQAAVSSRYTSLAGYYQPETLATHLTACATRRLDAATSFCDGGERQWQAGRYRWVDVFRSLHDDTSKSQPHPSTTEWRQRGLHLPGATQAEQLQAWRRHPDTWLPPRAAIEGVGSPPACEQAASQLSNAADPIDRLTEAITFLHTATDWPETRLYPDAWRARETAT